MMAFLLWGMVTLARKRLSQVQASAWYRPAFSPSGGAAERPAGGGGA